MKKSPKSAVAQSLRDLPSIDYARDPISTARELIGANLCNANGQGIGVVTQTQAFDHLIGTTLARYEQKTRKPGEIFIMPYRAGRLINVVVAPNEQTEAPQVVWLMEVRNQLGEVLKTGRFFKENIEKDLDSLDGVDVNTNPVFKIVPGATTDQVKVNFTTPKAGKLRPNSLGIYEL